ncbi:hypothetical protein FACUT_10872 [Fusarium acutatum]|uniref:Apple domain-containing protein n=1 Tax=Fusarium acutatum TaxID=78861 RepID=A0A8H4NDH1_9HYPO|nr:hypothetical protein FACUT_10872 [Fusarium acutatum]
MTYGKSLLLALAAVSAVVAGPCKPSTTGQVLSSTTIAIEETSTTATSIVGETTIVDTATVSYDTTTMSHDTTTVTTTTMTEVETTTTAALTTTTVEADVTTTTTVAETTSTAPCAAAPTACGIYGYFVDSNTLEYITSLGTKDSAKDCVQACADYPECEVVDYYNQAANGWEKGTCQFWKGEVKTDGMQSPYQWYQACCLANM